MADDPQEGAGLIAEADNLVGQALETKRRAPKAAASESAKLDLGGPAPGPANTMMVKAPPPPPPPPPPQEQAQQIASSLPPPPGSSSPSAMTMEYWHVVGASDMPAIDLYRQLRQKGFEAVLHGGSDRLTRVLAGPYPDDAAANKAKASLTTAGFRVLRRWQ